MLYSWGHSSLISHFSFLKTSIATLVAIPNCTLWSSFADSISQKMMNDDGLRWELYTLSRTWSLFAFLLKISQAHGLGKPSKKEDI